MKTWWIRKVAKGIAFAIVAVTIFTFIVMGLWNALVPELFSGPVLSFWQAAGLLLLSHILLRGWAPWRHRGGWRRDHWRRGLKEKLDSMKPEEREKFMSDWGRRCGCYNEDEPNEQQVKA
jgi:hypothetical protein